MPAHKQIERIETFNRLTPNGKTILAQGTALHSFSRGNAILHKGQPVSGAYLVVDGRLRVFTVSPNGTEATLYFIAPGEVCVLALNCLFSDLLYPAWVQAEAATTVAVIPGAVYRRLFETEIIVQNLTVQALGTLVYRLMAELELVHSNDITERLTHFILNHANSNGRLDMTQQKLSQHLGTTREVIARSLNELSGKGLLRTQRGSIAITDLFGLRRILTPGIHLTKR
jgi:CRP/FNR family transcriptional regulator